MLGVLHVCFVNYSGYCVLLANRASLAVLGVGLPPPDRWNRGFEPR